MTENKAVSVLKDILRMDTTLSNEKEVTDYLEKLLNDAGIETEQVEYAPGRNQMIARMKGTEPGKVLGFTGHSDVVPVGEIDWIHPPFAAEEIDGKIYARGASDMKSGLAAMVMAMLEMKEQKVPFKGDIELLVTVGEESAAIGSGQLVEKNYGNDLDALVIGEPTGLNIIIAHQGAFWLRLTTFGQTAHGSMPQLGINAVEHMVKLLGKFDDTFDFFAIKDDVVGSSSSSINIINGGRGTNVVPDKCTVEIDIRTVEGQSHDDILKKMNEMIAEVQKDIPDMKVEVEVINDLLPMNTNGSEEFVQLLYKVVQEFDSSIKPPFGSTGYTDGSQFMRLEKDFPITICGPGVPQMAHQPDEYVVIEDYLKSIEVYKKVAEEFLK